MFLLALNLRRFLPYMLRPHNHGSRSMQDLPVCRCIYVSDSLVSQQLTLASFSSSMLHNWERLGMHHSSAEDTSEANHDQRLAKIRSGDAIDLRYGFTRYSEAEKRSAWLANVGSAEIFDADSKVFKSVCNFYFIDQYGEYFKISYPYRPYIYLAVLPSFENQAASFISRKYYDCISSVEIEEKEDLDLKNHLSGLKKNYLKVKFTNVNDLLKFKKDFIPTIHRNQERQKNCSSYTRLLTRHFGASKVEEVSVDVSEKFIDIREHDIPYHMRVCIDKKIFVGKWYEVVGRDRQRLPSVTPHVSLVDVPELTILAYDIEVTKLPLKFPDSSIDEIMMISYVVSGQGYLIINRQIVAEDVEDFEYTPKPEYKGKFHILNVSDEKATIRAFFEHIIRARPLVIVTYNGDSFDWPFVEARAKIHGLKMQSEIGFYKTSAGEYRNRCVAHMDAYKWVKRDSYLPMGSQNLKACTRAKLGYDPLELDPEQMCPMAKQQPQTLANYSVSDAVATYYLYLKYVHPFIFALCSIIPLGPDDVISKGSGTLCEALLLVEAQRNNIIFPNKQTYQSRKVTEDGHVIESETYVGGHVEALESGVFRADIPTRFRVSPAAICELKNGVRKTFRDALTIENEVEMDDVLNFDEVCQEVEDCLADFISQPMRMEKPKIYHLDVGAMYPNIILTNRLQPSATVTDEDCIACDFNKPDARCKRLMQWEWRGEILPATRGEYERMMQRLENECFGKPLVPFHSLSHEMRVHVEKERIHGFCKRAYGKTHLTKSSLRQTTICQRENPFYVNAVKAFRDRRYEYKTLLKEAKKALSDMNEEDANGRKKAVGRIILYESLQLAHKCILNSFYGYVMRKGSRWFSMEMAGIVCHTGASIIREARKLIEQIGKALELDTDGIWCLIPSSIPDKIRFKLKSDRSSVSISYPGAILNSLIRDKFTNDQYHEVQEDSTCVITTKNSIMFEVDGPYLAMILPASREEGKRLKKRYAVFNFDGSLAELKGFEIKRRGELALVKYFQSTVFKAFLAGNTLEEAYHSAANEANYWLDVLYSKGIDLPDHELFDLICENRSMSKKLEDYGKQKSTSISTAKRLAEFLGDNMVKDAGLACKFFISKKPIGDPIAERAVPLAIFEASDGIKLHCLRKWTKDHGITENTNIRDLIDWEYYVERFTGVVQKIITIPAVLQNVPNPIPKVSQPSWLEDRCKNRLNDHAQLKISDLFKNPVETLGKEFSPGRTSNSVRNFVDSVCTFQAGYRKRQKSEGVEIRVDICTDEAPEKRACIDQELARKTIAADGVLEWIQYLKKKWRTEKEREHSLLPPALLNKKSLLWNFHDATLSATWQIIRISGSPDKNCLTLWCIINNQMRKFSIRVPRSFYVNDRSIRTGEGTMVKRVLPRMRPALNLYHYSVDEEFFDSSIDEFNRELCAMRIEGIYESQVPKQFATLMHVGCCCKPVSGTSIPMSLEHFERVLDCDYLPGESTNNIFYYEHRHGNRCIIGVFNTASGVAFICIVDSAKIEPNPSASKIYAEEKARLGKDHAFLIVRHKTDIEFQVKQFKSLSSAHDEINKYLNIRVTADMSPFFVTVISNQSFTTLTKSVKKLADYPLIRIHHKEPPDLFNVLDWRRVITRRIIQHYFNVFIYLQDYIELSRYLHIPIGNIPEDLPIFVGDLLFSRNLIEQNYVLWASQSSRPDLGGKEWDDGRIGDDWHSLCVNDHPFAVINNESFETSVCTELELGAVVVTALVHSSRIAQAEGGSDSVGFATGSTLEADCLLGRIRSIAHYDEFASVSGALKILRCMLQECIKDIYLNKNNIADQLIVNINRWIRSSQSLLYDPAITRAVDVLVTKFCLLLVAEVERLGARVIHASSSRLIISTKRAAMDQSKTFVDGLIGTLGKNILFAALSVKPARYWNVLLWSDIQNFVGICVDENTGKEQISMKLAMADALPNFANCSSIFQQILVGYCVLSFRKLISGVADEEFCEYRKHLVAGNVSEGIFQFVTAPQVLVDDLSMPATIGSRDNSRNVRLQFSKAVLHFISLDSELAELVTKVESQVLRLLDIDPSSDDAAWRPLKVSSTLYQLYCSSCNQCSDLEALQKSFLCEFCSEPFPLGVVEHLLIDRVNQLFLSFVLQDLKCLRCDSVKRDNLARFCECSGVYDYNISKVDFEFNIRTFARAAEFHEFDELQELCRWILM